MKPALHNLIKLLARIAVEKHLDELRQAKELRAEVQAQASCDLRELASASTTHAKEGITK